MAARAYWKGSLKLSLVSCPVLKKGEYIEIEKEELEAGRV